MPPIEIKNSSQFKELIGCEKLTVVDFFTTWCPPCKAIAPVYSGWADKFPEIQFTKSDAEANDDISLLEGITCYPTFKLYKNGQLLETVLGDGQQEIRDAILKHSNVDILS